MSDPRVDQVGQNAADPGETNDDGDVDDEEVVKELREKDIVDLASQA